MNEDDQSVAWSINSNSGLTLSLSIGIGFLILFLVYNKLVNTALRYTPIVLEHHVPYKILPNGTL